MDEGGHNADVEEEHPEKLEGNSQLGNNPGFAPRRSAIDSEERRKEGNRLSASRFHFRRKAEVQQLEKDCDQQEGEVAALRQTLARSLLRETSAKAQLKKLQAHIRTLARS
ncbi:hypothetical protein WJX72_007277 [[Myrmecia] bisecta]|uniref:BZIP domain-containing protein n=1 Tax=[Myrmecia] bisecta TaxID=41462 RepID=A0AAW1R803_9CHLO